MDPYIMIWGIDQAFSLLVTGGDPFPGQLLSPAVGQTINQGAPYKYVLFNTLNVDIYSQPGGGGEKIASTTIKMVTDSTGVIFPKDSNDILQFNYDQSQSTYPGTDHWQYRNYDHVTSRILMVGPPIITNAGWNSGQGNTDSTATVGDNFWVQDYGMDEPGRWTASGGAIYQSTDMISGSGLNVGSRAYPIHINNGAPTWDASGGLGVAFDGLWQIDIKIGSPGTSGYPFCETFYLAERANLSPGPSNYTDGSGGDGFGYSREIDIMETRWNGGSLTEAGPQTNLPNGDNTGWNPDSQYQNQRMRDWSEVGGAPTQDFITFGCLIRGDNLWFYAYKPDGSQWYSSEAIPKNSAYVQNSPFVPYLGTWWVDKTKTHVPGGFSTGYNNFVYLAQDDLKITGKNPKDNPEAFGKVIIPG